MRKLLNFLKSVRQRLTPPKKERYYLLRARDIKTIGELSVRERELKWIDRTPLLLFLITALASALIFVPLRMEYRHKKEMKAVSEKYEEEVTALKFVRDSLILDFEEREAIDSFMLLIAEACINPNCPQPTHDVVWEFVQRCKPWYPDIIMMQAVQESGCGVSAVGRRCNNLFGMKKPQTRKLRCDKNRKNRNEAYAEYENWKFSVIDRILWDKCLFKDYRGKPTREEYLKKFDTIYNTETKGYAQMIHKNAAKYRELLEKNK